MSRFLRNHPYFLSPLHLNKMSGSLDSRIQPYGSSGNVLHTTETTEKVITINIFSLWPYILNIYLLYCLKALIVFYWSIHLPDYQTWPGRFICFSSREVTQHFHDMTLPTTHCNKQVWIKVTRKVFTSKQYINVGWLGFDKSSIILIYNFLSRRWGLTLDPPLGPHRHERKFVSAGVCLGLSSEFKFLHGLLTNINKNSRKKNKIWTPAGPLGANF